MTLNEWLRPNKRARRNTRVPRIGNPLTKPAKTLSAIGTTRPPTHLASLHGLFSFHRIAARQLACAEPCGTTEAYNPDTPSPVRHARLLPGAGSRSYHAWAPGVGPRRGYGPRSAARDSGTALLQLAADLCQRIQHALVP
jgi:hypothetical protein